MTSLLKRPAQAGGTVRSRALTWAPPDTTGWTPQTVTSGGIYFFTTSTDVVLTMPAFAVNGLPTDSSHEALVTVKNVRDVVLIGGHVDVPATVQTRMTSAYNDGDPTIAVASTTGYPSVGKLNIGGYQFDFTGKTATTFTGVARASFSYSDAHAFPLAAGTVVWTGEQSRGCFSFINCRNVFIEGVKGTGDVVDFIRYQSSIVGSTLTIQNCHVDACLGHEGGTFYDGHPDCIQCAAGPTTMRIDRFTGYTSGRGVINKADAGNPPTTIQARDVEFIGDSRFPRCDGVPWDNAYSLSTTWDCSNCWATSPPERSIVATTSSDTSKLDRQIRRGRPETEFVPANTVGVGYTSPGYLP
jgi:hypothetical protein